MIKENCNHLNNKFEDYSIDTYQKGISVFVYFRCLDCKKFAIHQTISGFEKLKEFEIEDYEWEDE